MGHFVLGCKALFRVWTDDAFASQVGRWLGNHPAGAEPAATPPPPTPVLQAVPLPRQPRTPHPSAAPAAKTATGTAATKTVPVSNPAPRHEALSLLAVLQRDARLLDFLKEPLTGFSDAEVGAATRPVHKEAAAVIERIFGVVPLCEIARGTDVEIPAEYDSSQYRLLGDVPEEGGLLHGVLVHPGWKAVRADVPAWNGRPDAASVVSPIEVEF